MNFIRNLFSREKTGHFKLERTDDGQWMVTRKFHILYMGTKEKCKLYIDNQLKNNNWDKAVT